MSHTESYVGLWVALTHSTLSNAFHGGRPCTNLPLYYLLPHTINPFALPSSTQSIAHQFILLFSLPSLYSYTLSAFSFRLFPTLRILYPLIPYSTKSYTTSMSQKKFIPRALIFRLITFIPRHFLYHRVRFTLT